MNPPNVILFTREGCHLCENALAVLSQFGLYPKLVDIDQDPKLVECYNECVPVVVIDGLLRSAPLRSAPRYNECVPVVVIDGVERFRGEVNPVLLGRLLDG